MLPDEILWKIFEFKPATDYKAGCAVYVEEISLEKDMPGDTRVLKISVLFKFNPNIDERWVRQFRTREWQTYHIGIREFFYWRSRKLIKYERIIPKQEDRATQAEVTLSYDGDYSKTLADADIKAELYDIIPVVMGALCKQWFVESDYGLETPLDKAYWKKEMENMVYEDDLKRYKLFSYFKMKAEGTMAISKIFNTQRLKY